MTLPPLSPEVAAALEAAAAAIERAPSLVVACHVGPDGDALGSILAAGLAFRRMGKQVTLGWGAKSVEVPAQYEFLPGTELLSRPDAFPQSEVAFAVDCASADRLECLRESFESASVLVNLDHHVSNTLFGTINVVDVEAPSSSELMLRLLERMGAPIDVDVATCLYTGLTTDTGRFSYASVSPRAHAAAARLIELGVKVDVVAQAVFESLPYGYLKTLGIVLQRCELDPPLVVSYLTQKDLRETGIGLDETESLIDVVRSIREADVAAVIKELDDGKWKVSLRSKGATDVGDIAQRYGGGGHKLASGFTSPADLAGTIALLRQELA